MVAIRFDQPIPQEAPARNYDPVPEGRYTVTVKDVQQRPNKANAAKGVAEGETGENFNFTYEIIDGDHAGRLIFQQYNYFHTSAQTREIAQEQVAAVFRAAKIYEPTDTSELFGIPLLAQIKVVPASGNFKPRNEIHYFPAEDEQEAPTPVAKAASTPAATKTAAPWKK